MVNDQKAFLALKIVEIIGEAEPYQLDPETIFFITSLLNDMSLYKISNKGSLFRDYSNILELLKFTNEKKINDKLKILSTGKTSISFKYSLIERLKSINCPESVICDLIGMAKRESFYSNEVNLDLKSSWLDQIKIL